MCNPLPLHCYKNKKTISRPGFEPELSVPQTDVLTTIPSRCLDQEKQITHCASRCVTSPPSTTNLTFYRIYSVSLPVYDHSYDAGSSYCSRTTIFPILPSISCLWCHHFLSHLHVGSPGKTNLCIPSLIGPFESRVWNPGSWLATRPIGPVYYLSSQFTSASKSPQKQSSHNSSPPFGVVGQANHWLSGRRQMYLICAVLLDCQPKYTHFLIWLKIRMASQRSTKSMILKPSVPYQ